MANPDLPRRGLVRNFLKNSHKISWHADAEPCQNIGKLNSQQTVLSRNTSLLANKQSNLAFTTEYGKLYSFTSPTRIDEVFEDKIETDEWFGVFGSCNGLILVDGDGKMLLVNPITVKQVTIPHMATPELQDFEYWNFVTYGFGYDSCSDDYKIVRIWSYLSKNGDGLLKTSVDVYSAKNGVGKNVDGCYPYGVLVPSRYAYDGGAFVNGALQWLICSKEGYSSCIAAFDLANEVFSEIPLPKEFVSDVDGLTRRMRTNGVSVVGGCLLIVDNFGNGATYIWIMKEYGVAESWVKFRIEAEDGIYKWDLIVATLCYVEDGEILCLTSGDILIACDLKGGTMRRVVLGGFDNWFANGMTFVDSLVSPEGSSYKDGENGC